MSNKCDICGKKIQFGNAVSHSKQHTKRPWMPNIQPTTLMVEGKPTRLNVCTRCLRNQRKMSS